MFRIQRVCGGKNGILSSKYIQTARDDVELLTCRCERKDEKRNGSTNKTALSDDCLAQITTKLDWLL